MSPTCSYVTSDTAASSLFIWLLSGQLSFSLVHFSAKGTSVYQLSINVGRFWEPHQSVQALRANKDWACA